MKVSYLGALAAGIKHPALEGYCVEEAPPSYYAVEVSEYAGVNGSLIEGDVLIVDESRLPGWDDLTIAHVDGMNELMRAVRVGAKVRLVPYEGGEGVFSTTELLRGVVVRQVRHYQNY